MHYVLIVHFIVEGLARCALYGLSKPEVFFGRECSLKFSHRQPRTILVHFQDPVNDLDYCVGSEIDYRRPRTLFREVLEALPKISLSLLPAVLW